MVIGVHSAQATLPPQSMVIQVAYLGRFGVQLFFLVSALTICETWTIRAGEKNQAATFLLRRAWRIAPLYYLFIPVYLATFGTSPTHWMPNGLTLFTLITNLSLTHSLFPSTVGGVVHGGWSISVEFVFYLLFPIIWARTSGLKPSTLMLLAAGLYGLSSAAYAHAISLITSVPRDLADDFLYLNPTNQLFVFLTGIYLYRSQREHFLKRLSLISFPACVTTMLCFPLGVAPPKTALFALVVTVLATLVAIAQNAPKELWALTKVGRLLGQRSYGMYLTHFLVIAGLKSLFSHPSWVAYLATYSGTVLASAALSPVIEKTVDRLIEPARRWSLNWIAANG